MQEKKVMIAYSRGVVTKTSILGVGRRCFLLHPQLFTALLSLPLSPFAYFVWTCYPKLCSQQLFSPSAALTNGEQKGPLQNICGRCAKEGLRLGGVLRSRSGDRFARAPMTWLGMNRIELQPRKQMPKLVFCRIMAILV